MQVRFVPTGGEPPGGGGGEPLEMLFASAFSTMTGTGEPATTDGGKWEPIAAACANCLVEDTEGLGFPCANALKVLFLNGTGSGWAEWRTGDILPLPEVGESQCFRFYVRVALPDGDWGDNQTHPIQDVFGSNSLENFGFIVRSGGNNGAGPIPDGQWSCEMWLYNATGNFHRCFILLEKGVTYRVEFLFHRLSSTTYQPHMRVHEVDDDTVEETLIATDEDINNDNATNTLDNCSPVTYVRTDDPFGINCGNNGLGGTPPWPLTHSWQSGIAVRNHTVPAEGWCGPYILGEETD